MHYDVKPGQIIEILSENVCQGLLQGLLIGGGMGIFVSYEAFLPIISSMIIQYMKYLLQMNYSVFKFDIAPMIIVSTSLGWRNTFSHQQPSFYTDFIQKGFNFVHIFFPADSNVLNVVFEKILEKKNTVNIISISKTNIRTVFSLSAAKKLKTCGYLMKEYWRHQKIDEEADIILCSVGDINTTECQFAIDIVTKYKSYKIKLVSLIDLFRFDKKNESCCSNDEFVSIFTTSKTVIFSYIGYPCDIKTLMLDYPNPERFVFLGYSNSYLTTNQYLLMLKSQISRYSIAKRIWDQLDPDNKYNHVLSKKLSIYDMQECQDMTEEDYLNLSPYV